MRTMSSHRSSIVSRRWALSLAAVCACRGVGRRAARRRAPRRCPTGRRWRCRRRRRACSRRSKTSRWSRRLSPRRRRRPRRASPPSAAATPRRRRLSPRSPRRRTPRRRRPPKRRASCAPHPSPADPGVGATDHASCCARVAGSQARGLRQADARRPGTVRPGEALQSRKPRRRSRSATSSSRRPPPTKRRSSRTELLHGATHASPRN